MTNPTPPISLSDICKQEGFEFWVCGERVAKTTHDTVLALIAVTRAAMKLRDEPHVVEYSERGFQLRHTLQCRIDGMFDCKIDAVIRGLGKPPEDMGTFNVRLVQSADGDDMDIEGELRPDYEDFAAELLTVLAPFTDNREE